MYMWCANEIMSDCLQKLNIIEQNPLFLISVAMMPSDGTKSNLFYYIIYPCKPRHLPCLDPQHQDRGAVPQ